MNSITILEAFKRAKEGKGILLIRKSVVRGQKCMAYGGN